MHCHEFNKKLGGHAVRVLFVIGTRPEAIKLAPVIKYLTAFDVVDVSVCLTGQHKTLLSDGLADFNISVDFSIDLMSEGQSVNDVVGRTVSGLAPILIRLSPDVVVVQGDTSSAMAAALVAFNCKVAVVHVEAGLRTGNVAEPWPEEMNRRIIGQIARLHFAPTQGAKANLLAEGIHPDTILVSGNTVIDALVMACDTLDQGGAAAEILGRISADKPMIVTTLHRRENLVPDRLRQVEQALSTLALDLGCQVVFPAHPNPLLGDMVRRLRDKASNLHLIPPLRYVPFVSLLRHAALILTDSGGIQEEAAYLGKNVLIMRHATERPEVLAPGIGELVGVDAHAIVSAVSARIGSCCATTALSAGPGLGAFGSGTAAVFIGQAIMEKRWAS